MRVLVVGGTGRTGARIAAAAVAAGHGAVALGRSAGPDTLPAGVEAVRGDATDAAALRTALRGIDAVVVSLSIPRAGPSPFARVTGPPDLHSRSARLLLAAMGDLGVRRLVKISAQGVGPSAPRAGWGFRALVAVSNLGPAFADHAVADALVEASATDFTIVHPPALADGPGTGRAVAGESEETGTFTRLPREDLARWVVATLPDASFHRRRVTLRPG